MNLIYIVLLACPVRVIVGESILVASLVMLVTTVERCLFNSLFIFLHSFSDGSAFGDFCFVGLFV